MGGTLKMAVMWAVVVLCAVAAMIVYTMPQETAAMVNRAAEARGWREPFLRGAVAPNNTFGPLLIVAKSGRPILQYGGATVSISWGPWCRTQVPVDDLSVGFTFRHALWSGMESLDLYLLQGLRVTLPYAEINIRGAADAVNHPGQYGFEALWGENLIGTWWFDLPEGDDVTWVELPCEWKMTGGSLQTRVGTNPIGPKNATHAKEHLVEERLFLEAGDTGTITVNGETLQFELPSSGPTDLFMQVTIDLVDADDWFAYMGAVKYPMSMEGIQFCGTQINTTEFDAATWGGTAASVNKLWVEGFGTGCIGWWASEDFYNGAYVYNTFPTSTITAPLSFDFAGMFVVQMDGTDRPDAIVYCTGLRLLDVDGNDIGPWKGTIGDLRALGRVIQASGCYWWDSKDADMQPKVEIYLSLENEALLIEVAGGVVPSPERVAVHEAGHALAAVLLGIDCDGCTMIPNGDQAGTTHTRTIQRFTATLPPMVRGQCVSPRTAYFRPDPEATDALGTVTVAGRQAEFVAGLSDQPGLALGDGARLQALARQLHGTDGLAVGMWMAERLRHARALLEEHRGELDALTAALRQAGTLTGDQVRAIVAEHTAGRV